MRIISVNVSLGREVPYRGKMITTGIFKEPVAGRVFVSEHHVEGDRQSDRRVHGGPYKTVYAYSLEHYDYWERTLDRKLPPGAFGENLTIEGLDEESICVGDTLRAGDVLLQAIQPRSPCFKLGIRFGTQTMLKRFREAERWGIYFRVLETGFVAVGDDVSVVERHPARFPVPEVMRLRLSASPDAEMLRRGAALEVLPAEMRAAFHEAAGIDETPS